MAKKLEDMVEFPRLEVAAGNPDDNPILNPPLVASIISKDDKSVAHKSQMLTKEATIEDLAGLRDYIFNNRGVDAPIKVQLFVSSHGGDIIMQWL